MEIKNKRIAVDLTPILPGGENGGAKLMTLELIRNLCNLHPTTTFLLLTSSSNHQELACLKADNVERIQATSTVIKTLKEKSLLGIASPFIPLFAKKFIKSLVRFFSRIKIQKHFLEEHRADLLFCPFTAPNFFYKKIPLVSVIYDLQHKTYPQFFSASELNHREHFFNNTCRLSKKIICISNYVRNTVIKNKKLNPDHVHTVHIKLSSRIAPTSKQIQEHLFVRLGLIENRFLLFPANFWPHKNHQMLFTAFGMYLDANPTTDLKLVCSGAPCPRMNTLRKAVNRMGLEKTILFPGYVSNEELGVLMRSCKALIFPSLYEGFGMPITEAMTIGMPVLCSNVTSLPEVADDAALFFDPKRPQTIVDAITTLETNPKLINQLIQRGKKRAALFSNAQQMAQEYSIILHQAMP